MGIIGIITCEIMEMEFAYLLTSDPYVKRISVLENIKSKRLIEMLETQSEKYVERIPHIKSFRCEDSHDCEVIVRVMDLALHRSGKILRKALESELRELSHYVDAFLLGYGLCGNSLINTDELLQSDIPVFIPMDMAHPVDDCIGLFIGGRHCYQREQFAVPGTFFITPGWSHHWKRIFHEVSHGKSPKIIKKMFSNYKRSLLIVTPVMEETYMRKNVEDLNKLLGLYSDTCEGTINLLNQAWQSAIEFLNSKYRKL